jgi:hypothetical protein
MFQRGRGADNVPSLPTTPNDDAVDSKKAVRFSPGSIFANLSNPNNFRNGVSGGDPGAASTNAKAVISEARDPTFETVTVWLIENESSAALVLDAGSAISTMGNPLLASFFTSRTSVSAFFSVCGATNGGKLLQVKVKLAFSGWMEFTEPTGKRSG